MLDIWRDVGLEHQDYGAQLRKITMVESFEKKLSAPSSALEMPDPPTE